MEKVTLDAIMYVSTTVLKIPSKSKCISDSEFMRYGLNYHLQAVSHI